MGSEPEAQVHVVFQLALGRALREAELNECFAFLSEQAAIHIADAPPPDVATRSALADLCHKLLSTDEFLYVE